MYHLIHMHDPSPEPFDGLHTDQPQPVTGLLNSDLPTTEQYKATQKFNKHIGTEPEIDELQVDLLIQRTCEQVFLVTRVRGANLLNSSGYSTALGALCPLLSCPE